MGCLAVWLTLEPKWLRTHSAAPAVVVAAAVALPFFVFAGKTG